MKKPQGNLKETSFPRLLQAVYREGDAYGVLDILREPVKKRFFFKDGHPVFSTSNVLGEVLGRLLMDEGLITQADYETSLEKVIRERKKHGEVLVEMGLITSERLDEFLALQLKRRLLNIFSWNEGVYRYVSTDSLPTEINVRPAHTARLILEGISLGFYPPENIMSDLGGYLDKNLKLDEKTLEACSLDDLGLNLQEKRFVAKFDGTRPLAEILDQSDLLKHRALSVALAAVITGVVRPVGEARAEEDETESAEARLVETSPETRIGAELMFMKARSAIIEREYAKAADLLEQITELNPTEAEYWAYLGWAVFSSDPSKVEEAERILKDSIDLNNDLDSAWCFLGHVFAEKGDAEWAERAFRTAVEKNPWRLDALSGLKRLEISQSLASGAADRWEGARGRAEGMGIGLAEDPFGPVPAEKFHYTRSGENAAQEELVRWIKKRSGPVLLEGVEGSGKTTFLLGLLERLSSDKVLAAVVLDPPSNELDLIKAVNAEVGASTDAPSVKEQLLSLGMRLSQNKIQGGHSVVFIDNAHRLTDRCLKLIQYLSRLKTLQLVLLGEPSLNERLKDARFAELDGKLANRTSLEPLEPREVGGYIRHRLSVAGVRSISLDEAAVDGIFARSGGVPALVNRYAWDALASDEGYADAAATLESGTDTEANEPPEQQDTGNAWGRSQEPWSFEEEAVSGVEDAGAEGPPAGNVIDFSAMDETRTQDTPAEEDGWGIGGLGDGETPMAEPGPEVGRPFEIFGHEPETETEGFEEAEAGTNEGGWHEEEAEEAAAPSPEIGAEEATGQPGQLEQPPRLDEPPVENEPPKRSYASAAGGGGAQHAAQAAGPLPEAAPRTAEARPTGEEAEEGAGQARAGKSKRSLAKVILWVVIMLVAGLVIGSAIGVIIHGPVELVEKIGLGGGSGVGTPPGQ